MLIKNGMIFMPDASFQKGDLYVDGQMISKKDIGQGTDNMHQEDENIIDATGLYVIPGLIDTHIHGALGHDFCEGTDEALDTMCTYLARQGITAFLPTSMTLEREVLHGIFKNYGEYDYTHGARPVGIHMEGPFFESAKKGAQNGAYLKNADEGLYRELQDLSKQGIKVVSISPKVEGALEFIEKMKEETNFSLAHTTSDYDLACESFNKGANRVTHLYNAMLPFSHREPAVMGAAFDHKNIMVELISDGIHVHPSVVRSTFATYTDDRVVLVSDNMMAVGMSDGEYELGGQKVRVEGPKATLEGGTIAGSVTNLMACMRKAVEFGIPLESAVKAATINAAKSIQVDDKMGSLEVGKLANIVLLDKELQIKAVFIEGKPVALN